MNPKSSERWCKIFRKPEKLFIKTTLKGYKTVWLLGMKTEGNAGRAEVFSQ